MKHLFIKSPPASERILVSAEELFADYGFHAVSIRMLAAKARVNVASVNYHFYDLEALLREILVRRLREVNAIRLARLAEAEARARPMPVAPAEIFRIMARPLFQPETQAMGFNRNSRRLLGRLLVDPFPNRDTILATEFEPVMARFAQALRRHAPGLAPVDYMWRFSLIVGSLHHSLATLHEMKSLTRGLCADDHHEAALEAFVALGVRALVG